MNMLVSEGVSSRKGNESKQLFGVIGVDDLGGCGCVCFQVFIYDKEIFMKVYPVIGVILDYLFPRSVRYQIMTVK